ncbi:hypothetical protein H2201_008204 [Coniosporium apollinis]|uniref:Uncharacterized protein n=2 Tax=Coniosporium TaxID=2810619 RepID=A0ABQ9NKF0_9PEZI|nr:hypothetical protein H2199_002890 [Cladosporium sp. JES 115]KAJ9657408.1 hypothetical protein H2201_008204 [Coniosporium apollinis]
MNPTRPTQSIRTLSDSSTLAETPSAPTSPDMAATTAPSSYFAARRTSSPAEQSFFGVIADKVRGRSRSRSRSRIRRDRSRSPLPPTQIDATDSASTLVANGYTHEQSGPSVRPQQRQTPGSSQSSLSQRQTSFGSRTESERYYYGRHSNDWLFGGISVTATVKGLVSKKESGS